MDAKPQRIPLALDGMSFWPDPLTGHKLAISGHNTGVKDRQPDPRSPHTRPDCQIGVEEIRKLRRQTGSVPRDLPQDAGRTGKTTDLTTRCWRWLGAGRGDGGC